MERKNPLIPFVIFTDLDGTLIRHADYSFEPVRPLLTLLRQYGIPVVLSSSKTRAEIEAYRIRMGIGDPFVVENGGAVFVPSGYFASPPSLALARENYVCIELGKPYPELVEALRNLKSLLKLHIMGFHEMDLAEVVRWTGLPKEEAALALRREYDEPFIFLQEPNPTDLEVLKQQARDLGCRVVRGGRFFHLTGASNKGRAVRILKKAYRENRRVGEFVGLGDSANDLSLLRNVDIPYLVAKPDGSHDPGVLRKLPQVQCVPAPGPDGWFLAVSQKIESLSRTRRVSN
ncbi:MAG: HAD-IIB family hydrolase [Acidobacteriota bacterium]